MMKLRITDRLAFALLCCVNIASAGDLTVLTYHDVVANPGADRYATSRSMFVAHMDYLQQNGYRVLSLDEVSKIIERKASFPAKAAVLTFDDGLKSYQDFVVPLLSIYEFPSVVSLVTSWVDGLNVPSEYRGKVMTWQDMKLISRLPLVSVITHTHDLHHGIQANPQSNLRSASNTRQYFPQSASYETEVQFRDRIRRDLGISVARIKRELGFSPQGIAWPYGDYDSVVYEEAQRVGLDLQFVLGEANAPGRPAQAIRRLMVVDQPIAERFAELLERSTVAPIHRFAEIDLSIFINKSEVEQETVLSELLERLARLKINTVIVSPVTADGTRAFFSTDELGVAADVLDRVLHQIRMRINVRYLCLRIPGKIAARDSKRFFTEIARRHWFNAMAFSKNFNASQVQTAKEIVAYYRPQVLFGSDNLLARNFDFTLAEVAMDATERQSSSALSDSNVWISIQGARDDAAREAAIARLMQQGFVHIGYRLNFGGVGDEQRRSMRLNERYAVSLSGG